MTLLLFSSTLSVGINLNSTQISILDPNTMWTIDQAEHMIGRVGHVDADGERCFVVIATKRISHFDTLL